MAALFSSHCIPNRGALHRQDLFSVPLSSFGPRDVSAVNPGSGRMSGSPFLGYLFWRSKKGDWPRAATKRAGGVQANFAPQGIRPFDKLRANGE